MARSRGVLRGLGFELLVQRGSCCCWEGDVFSSEEGDVWFRVLLRVFWLSHVAMVACRVFVCSTREELTVPVALGGDERRGRWFVVD